MSSLPLNKVFEDTLRGYDQPRISKASVAHLLAAWPVTYQSPVSTFVGLEYEIENVQAARRAEGIHPHHSDVFSALWDIVEDGSLRNRGREFVSKPIKDEHIPAAIASLGAYIEREVSKADPSSRCGIHVHVNANDLTVTQVFGWISLYRIFERQLYKFSGERDKNLFCLPTWAYDGNIMNALGYLPTKQNSAAISIATNGFKYSGLNTKPLRDKGTLEFRQMQTVRDYDKIALWVEYLTRIKGAAAEECVDYDSFMVYLDKLSTLNTSSEYSELMVSVFGERCKFLELGDWKKDMAQGVISVKEQLSYIRKVVKTGDKYSSLNFGEGQDRINAAGVHPDWAAAAAAHPRFVMNAAGNIIDNGPQLIPRPARPLNNRQREEQVMIEQARQQLMARLGQI